MIEGANHMDSRERQDIYDKSTIRESNIKISATHPALKGKIHTNVGEGAERVNWYIKFNIELDPGTVHKGNMSVTETNGYILETVIHYDDKRHLIVISPTDIYMQNEYYLLNIGKKVMSARGQSLKREIHIMFKLINNQITKFKLLKKTVKVAKPRPRTKQYRKELEKRISSSKVYSFDESLFQKVPQHKLPYGAAKINIILLLAGVVTTLAGIWLKMMHISWIGLCISGFGLLHVVYQLIQRSPRSMLVYNVGVIFFNYGRYAAAQKIFRKAIAISMENEMAEYGLNKVSFYLYSDRA